MQCDVWSSALHKGPLACLSVKRTKGAQKGWKKLNNRSKLIQAFLFRAQKLAQWKRDMSCIDFVLFFFGVQFASHSTYQSNKGRGVTIEQTKDEGQQSSNRDKEPGKFVLIYISSFCGVRSNAPCSEVRIDVPDGKREGRQV